MSQILIELVKLANLIVTMTKATASAGRVQTVFETQSSMDFGTQTLEEIDEISFENVSFCYKNAGENSISNISFKAQRGQTVGILGGTGAGKTTLVNLAARFYDCSDGKVLINGRNIAEYNENSLREKIAVVPQKPSLVSGTIRDNLLWGNKDATDEQLNSALETAQALDVINSKENGIMEMLSYGGKNLSGGQRQRLTIARALVRRPDVLILDDSLSALDYSTDLKLRTALSQMENPPLKLIVSQRASSLINADLIIVLDDGEAVGVGKHDELLDNCEVYREIYYSQFEKGGTEK